MRPLEITPRLLRSSHPLRDPPASADKEAWGRVLVVAGAAEVPGAGLLSGEAALRAGAGKVTLAVPRPFAIAIGVAFPEARVVGLGRGSMRLSSGLLVEHGAALIGPGMDKGTARSTTRAALAARGTVPLVLDAAAIGGLWTQAATVRRRAARGPLVLTPHAGEMANLCGWPKDDVLADPVGAACAAARHLGALVVLKGATTVVATPDGATFRHARAIPGLATAGSGDVLAGLIAGLIARNDDVLAACLWGVFLHAQAGLRLAKRIGATGYLARELAAEVPALIDTLN